MKKVIACLVLGTLQVASVAASQKAEVPAAAAIEKSTQEVALLFKNEIQAAVTDIQKNKLAQQLVSVASETKDDLPGKYALLKAALKLAVSSSNLDLGATVIKQLDSTFVVDPHGLTFTFLGKLAKSNTNTEVLQSIVDHCLAAQLELIGTDEQAVRHISRYRDFLLSILESGNEISRVKERSTYTQTTARAFLDLKTDPSNGHTNQLCGLHKLRSNDLPEALSHFLKSDNKIFRRAAELEQQTPTSFDAEIELAEAWLKTENPHASLRANYWLAKASKRLYEFSGLTRVRNQATLTGLTKRVEELSSMVMDATVLGKLFSLDATIEARLNYDGNVIRLVFWGNQFTEVELVHIKGLKKLKELSVVAKHLTDDGLKHLRGLTSLEVLWLAGTRISDTGLVQLKELKSLTHLSLRDTMVTDTGLLYLKGLTNLTHLSLGKTLITDAGLEHLVGLSNLEFLRLGDNEITGSGLVHLKELKSLEHLTLNSTMVTGFNLVHLKGLTKLKFLDLSQSKITDAGLVHLKGLTSLEQLDLNYNRGVTGAGLVYLKALTNLETLSLPYGSTDDNLVNLKGLTKLTYLNVHSDEITDVGLACLKALTKLQSLDISYTEITDAGLENLKGLKNLNALYLSPATVTDAGLVRLKDMTNLTHIGLTNLDVTDARLVHLKGLTKLRRLDLMATQISDTGLVHLKGLTNLETLDLRDNEITGTGLVYLKELKNLEHLLLAENQISDAGLEHLKALTKLQWLDIKRTAITDAGVADLQKALPNCKIETNIPSVLLKQFFFRFDRNDDGKISAEELPERARDEKMEQIDKNKDGFIDAKEAQAAVTHGEG